MSYDFEEQETLETVKAWWAQHGTKVVALALVVSGAFAGWRGWQYYERHQANNAMNYYELINAEADQSNIDSVKDTTAIIMKDYATSSYSSRAALRAAKLLADKGDVDGAINYLVWIINVNKDPSIVPLAQLHLASLYINQKDYAAAESVLAGVSQFDFSGLVQDKYGDLYLAQDQLEQAREHYKKALEAIPKDQSLHGLIQLKIDSLGLGDAS